MANEIEWTDERYTEMLKTDKEFAAAHDRRISAALQTYKKTETEKETEKPEAPDPTPDLDVRADRLDRKERALSLAIEKNLDPEQAFALLGLDSDSTDETRLDAAAEIRQAGRNEFLKANSRTPVVSLNLAPMGLKDLERMPDRMLEKVPGEVLDRAHAEMMDQGKKTLRERISASFGGKK